MAFSIVIADGIATVRVDGTPILADIQKAVRALVADPGYSAALNSLWNFRNASLAAIQLETLRLLADFLAEIGLQPPSKTAFLMATDLDFGIGRMWEGYAALKLPAERRVFRDIDAALEWLRA